MGIKDGYIITDLSSSIQQRTLTGGAVVAPFGFGHRGLQNLRGTCQPYSSFPGSSMPAWDRGDCGVPDDTVKMLLITQDSPVYTPVTYGTQWYTEIVDAEVTTTSSTHVGSMFLEPIINEITILASDNGALSNYVSTQIRNSTDNHLMASFEITFGTTSSATGVINIQPGVINNWYDIYLSASTNPGTASLEGIYVQYKI
jgi:hypothetical protein